MKFLYSRDIFIRSVVSELLYLDNSIGLDIMTSPILFANLRRRVDQPPSIAFLEIQSTVRDFKDQENDNKILGFFRIFDHLDSPALDEKHRKASLKGRKLALKVCQLLNGNALESLTQGNAGQVRNSNPLVYCGETAVLGGPPFEGRARDIEGISWYQEIRFAFPDHLTIPATGDFVSTQTLHFSCPTLKVEDAISKQLDQPVYDRVEILSGMCLLNARILESALSGNGGVDLGVIGSQKATLYEMEYIVRASSTVRPVVFLSSQLKWDVK
jgi:hypothetical protein